MGRLGAIADAGVSLGRAADASSIRAMLAARRNIVDNIVSAEAPRVIVRRGSDIPLAELSPSSDVLTYMDEIDISRNIASPKILDGTFAGSFIPEGMDSRMIGVVSYRPGERGTRRHELMHAYNNAAGRGYGGMPLASRIVAAVAGPDRGSARGQLGTVLDEAVAQRVGGAPLRDVNWGGYADNYRRLGLPYAAAAARALGVAARVPEGAAPAVLAGLAAGTALSQYRAPWQPVEMQGNPGAEDSIRILRKYAVPGVVGAGAAAMQEQ